MNRVPAGSIRTISASFSRFVIESGTLAETSGLPITVRRWTAYLPMSSAAARRARDTSALTACSTPSSDDHDAPLCEKATLCPVMKIISMESDPSEMTASTAWLSTFFESRPACTTAAAMPNELTRIPDTSRPATVRALRTSSTCFCGSVTSNTSRVWAPALTGRGTKSRPTDSTGTVSRVAACIRTMSGISSSERFGSSTRLNVTWWRGNTTIASVAVTAADSSAVFSISPSSMAVNLPSSRSMATDARTCTDDPEVEPTAAIKRSRSHSMTRVSAMIYFLNGGRMCLLNTGNAIVVSV